MEPSARGQRSGAPEAAGSEDSGPLRPAHRPRRPGRRTCGRVALRPPALAASTGAGVHPRTWWGDRLWVPAPGEEGALLSPGGRQMPEAGVPEGSGHSPLWPAWEQWGWQPRGAGEGPWRRVGFAPWSESVLPAAGTGCKSDQWAGRPDGGTAGPEGRASAETEVRGWSTVSPGRTGLGPARRLSLHRGPQSWLPAIGVWTATGSQIGERVGWPGPSRGSEDNGGCPHPWNSLGEAGRAITAVWTTKQNPRQALRTRHEHEKVETRRESRCVFCLVVGRMCSSF